MYLGSLKTPTVILLAVLTWIENVKEAHTAVKYVVVLRANPNRVLKVAARNRRIEGLIVAGARQHEGLTN